ncbi:MAG: hypothetical protein R3300_12250 [Candidatus Promineifilaceae bacterium]|nr:hypothetical protein [Candidatus Promineifilaceae bacterium]
MKLLLSYNIKPESAQAYYEFVLGRYVPTMQSMGLEMSEAWHTAYGDYPDRLIGFVAKDRDTMMDVIEGETWHTLNDRLFEFVTDFEYKVINFELGFQF